MLFADLTDYTFFVECQLADDKSTYWEYELIISMWDDKYHRHVSVEELAQLRENCKRILQATASFQGGN